MSKRTKMALMQFADTQAQIALRFHAGWGWSGPSFFAYRINRDCSICQQTENAKIRLHGCSCWSEPSLFAYDIRDLFPRCASVSVVGNSCTRSIKVESVNLYVKDILPLDIVQMIIHPSNTNMVTFLDLIRTWTCKIYSLTSMVRTSLGP